MLGWVMESLFLPNIFLEGGSYVLLTIMYHYMSEVTELLNKLLRQERISLFFALENGIKGGRSGLLVLKCVDGTFRLYSFL